MKQIEAGLALPAGGRFWATEEELHEMGAPVVWDVALSYDMGDPAYVRGRLRIAVSDFRAAEPTAEIPGRTGVVAGTLFDGDAAYPFRGVSYPDATIFRDDDRDSLCHSFSFASE